MSDQVQNDLRSVIQTLNGVRRALKAQRRQLAQTVAGVEDVEMVAARVGLAINQVSAARDLYSRLLAPNDVPTQDPALTEIKLGLNPYGYSRPSAVEAEHE
jgi:hypothetical protein